MRSTGRSLIRVRETFAASEAEALRFDLTADDHFWIQEDSLIEASKA